MGIRRKIALWICPQIALEIAALARPDRASASRSPRTHREAIRLAMADHLRTLARIFQVYRGNALCWRDVKVARGEPINSEVLDYYDAYSVFSLLRRLDRDKESGCSEKLFFKAVVLFAEKWPADLEWPEDIPRPPKSEQNKEVA